MSERTRRQRATCPLPEHRVAAPLLPTQAAAGRALFKRRLIEHWLTRKTGRLRLISKGIVC
jgi:hypothetical protein